LARSQNFTHVPDHGNTNTAWVNATYLYNKNGRSSVW
jgi:hypothetical protein